MNSPVSAALHILNGLLVGAAVEAGFEAFETAGYILRYGLSSDNV